MSAPPVQAAPVQQVNPAPQTYNPSTVAPMSSEQRFEIMIKRLERVSYIMAAAAAVVLFTALLFFI
jgi:hypothetical protein